MGKSKRSADDQVRDAPGTSDTFDSFRAGLIIHIYIYNIHTWISCIHICIYAHSYIHALYIQTYTYGLTLETSDFCSVRIKIRYMSVSSNPRPLCRQDENIILSAAGQVLGTVRLRTRAQIARYGLMKEHILNHFRGCHVIQGIFFNQAIYLRLYLYLNVYLYHLKDFPSALHVGLYLETPM